MIQLVLTIVAALWTTPVGPLPSPVVPASVGAESALAPGAAFARAVTAELSAGGVLRGIEVADRGAERELELLVVWGERATRHRLWLAGAGERPIRYRRDRAPVPDEERTYRAAAELARALAGGPVRSLTGECGGFALEAARGGISVDPHDYYVVSARARGARARRLGARALAAAFDDGLALTAVARAPDTPPGAAAAFDLVLFDGHEEHEEHEEIVRLGLDDDGAVVAVELHWSPVAYRSDARRYVDQPALRRALDGGRIEAVELRGAPGGAIELRLLLPGGHHVLAPEAFANDADALLAERCPC